VFYLSPGFSANFQTMDGLKNAFFKGRLFSFPAAHIHHIQAQNAIYA